MQQKLEAANNELMQERRASLTVRSKLEETSAELAAISASNRKLTDQLKSASEETSQSVAKAKVSSWSPNIAGLLRVMRAVGILSGHAAACEVLG